MPVELTNLVSRYKGGVGRRNPDSIRMIVVHHDAGVAPTQVERVLPRLDSYHRQHDDVGGMPYHYVIDPWGTMYKCRETGEITAQARGSNRLGLAIMLMGYFHKDENFKGQKPTAAQLKALKALAKDLRVNLPNIDIVKPHKDVNGSRTVCPGNQFPYDIFAELK
jgi:N-acetyl-anhydromuramyl-L-alanine amidase AmpD